MNTLEIKKMCQNIYNDFIGMGRERKPEDKHVAAFLIHLYNTTDIDYEEVNWLWTEYLEKGTLDIATAIAEAKERIEQQKAWEFTKLCLIADLEKGI